MTTAVNAVSQAEFAKIMGWKSRSTVTNYKNAGRIVFDDAGHVLVEETKRRIFETADPNRMDVSDRHAENRGKSSAVNVEDVPKSEREHKAERMKYDALQSKLTYERAIGKMIEKSEVEAATIDVVTALRQAIENIPHRAAPELVGKDLDAIRATLKQEIHGALAEMEREFTKRLNQMGAEE